MKRNARKGIALGIGALAVMFGLGGCSSPKKAEVVPSSVAVLREESPVTIETGTSVLKIEKDGEKIYLVSTDSEGKTTKADITEAYNSMVSTSMDSTFKDIFEVALSCVGTAVSLAYLIFKIRRLLNKTSATADEANRNVNSISTSVKEQAKLIKDTNDSLNAAIKNNNDSLTASLRETNEFVGKAMNETNQTVKNVNEKMSETERRMENLALANEELRKSNEQLAKGYASLNDLTKAILMNQQLMASTDENFSSGVYRKVSDNVKGATAYAEQEKAKSEGKES